MESHVEYDENHPAHPSHQRRLAQAVMRRQLSLSLKIAAIFMAMLLGLPLINYFLPGLANAPLFGFTLTWLFLAVLFYPVTWLLSWMFIQQSNDIEAEIAESMRRDPHLLHHQRENGYVAAAEDVPSAGDPDKTGEENI